TKGIKKIYKIPVLGLKPPAHLIDFSRHCQTPVFAALRRGRPVFVKNYAAAGRLEHGQTRIQKDGGILPKLTAMKKFKKLVSTFGWGWTPSYKQGKKGKNREIIEKLS
ncbi:MAG: hypothetical protein JW947_05875, partial [Sedimentisphaerales bacterium]|nr:hypothetical protein [Sedimentisphaerales bacterium]